MVCYRNRKGVIPVDEIQRLNAQIETLTRKLEESQRREQMAKKEIQQLNDMLKTVVYVLACVVISGT